MIRVKLKISIFALIDSISLIKSEDDDYTTIGIYSGRRSVPALC